MLGGSSQVIHVPRADAKTRVRHVARVEVQRVGRARMAHQHRHRLDVFAVGEVQGGEGVPQGVGTHASEARLPSELVPIPLPVLI